MGQDGPIWGRKIKETAVIIETAVRNQVFCHDRQLVKTFVGRWWIEVMELSMGPHDFTL